MSYDAEGDNDPIQGLQSFEKNIQEWLILKRNLE